MEFNQRKKMDEHLDRLRDEFKHAIYKCRECEYRAFGAAVMIHEAQNKHLMIREEPLNDT